MEIPVRIFIQPETLAGRQIERSFLDADEAKFSTCYEVRRKHADGRWEAVLTQVTETMPPKAPQEAEKRYREDARLPMMEDGCFSARLEAKQRYREWEDWHKRDIVPE